MDINQVITSLYGNPYALFFVATWTIIWKGTALWKAAKNDSKFWFVILLVVNTVGLLEIAYIFILSKIDFSKISQKLNLSHLFASFKKGNIK